MAMRSSSEIRRRLCKSEVWRKTEQPARPNDNRVRDFEFTVAVIESRKWTALDPPTS